MEIAETNEFKKADILRIRLEKELGNKIDVLSKYRWWLDISKINSENNGYPSEEAYDEKNIKNFIHEMQS